MKITIEFDSNTDREQTIQLAVRAKAVDNLIDDLLFQLTRWIDENPSDEQARAFEKTQRWLCDQIRNRALYVPKVDPDIIVDRAGNPVPSLNQPTYETPKL